MDLNHLHPRHLRARNGWKPTPPRPLHKPLLGMSPGTSKKRRWFTYKGAADRLLRGQSFALKLKAARLELGLSRREYDRYRDQKWKATQ